MNILVISNIANGAGLQTDYLLLRAFLEQQGHIVEGVDFSDHGIKRDGPADLAIWLEVANQQLLHLARRHWLFANNEWLKPEYEPIISKHFEKVLAKTPDALMELGKKFPSVHLTGFLTRDQRDASVPREDRFLHVGGNSGFRNTQAVIEAWRSYRYYNGIDGLDAPLTIVGNSTTVKHLPTPGVTFHKRVTEEELKQLQNSHLFHLYPSAYEGWGQALHESQSVGAIILTTAAPPMDGFGCHFTVPAISARRNNLATLHSVSPAGIRRQVPLMLAQYNSSRARMQVESRMTFEKSNREFEGRFLPLLEAVPLATGKAPIALLGNHSVSYCTERDLAWTLEGMGHQVLAFQENADTTERILESCLEHRIKLFIYVHTHGWHTPGTMGMPQLLARLKDAGIITVSFHLDKYKGLNIGDGRESRVGAHPFWSSDFVFTADGGSQDWFHSLGVNHHWLPPGVVKKWCVRGTYRADLAVDVAFVGARAYHPEYPFRGQLIEFLENTYGDRFRVFTGYREQDLNDVYASAKVVVGDSCFGGSPFYWSDRVPETLGRGGFLIHPASTGLAIPGLVTYEPGNLSDLQDKIDYYLAHDRSGLSDAAMSWVRENETYTNRMQQLLRAVGL